MSNYAPPNKNGSGYIKGDCGHTVKVLDTGYDCQSCVKMAYDDMRDFIAAFVQDWEADEVHIDQVYYNRGKELLDILAAIEENRKYEQK